jgi:ribosomal protein S18 acetylase RimI-like enzyme
MTPHKGMRYTQRMNNPRATVSVPLIRAAVPADAALLSELSATSFHQAFDGSSKQENVDGYVEAAFNPAQLARELRDPRATFCLAEWKGQAVGYLKLYEGEVPDCVRDRQAIELARLYVRQEFLAQKIGAALMQKALDEAQRKGYTTIFLGVWQHNYRAQAFYHKWGFKKVGAHVFQMGDDAQTDWWMERKL